MNRFFTLGRTASICLLALGATQAVSACGDVETDAAPSMPDAAAPPASHEDHEVRAVLQQVARQSPLVERAVAPRSDGLEPLAHGFGSAAWRARAPAGHELGATFPATADGTIRVSPAQAESWSLRLTPEGAQPAIGASDKGRVLWQGAYAATSLVATAGARHAEWLLVLESEAAPTRWTWRMTLGAELHGPIQQPGGDLDFLDDEGEHALRMAPPWAVDADGRERAVHVEYDAERLSLALDTIGLRFPIVVDPLFSVPTIVNRNAWPSGAPGRTKVGVAYAPSAGGVMMVGGELDYWSGTHTHDSFVWNGSTWGPKVQPGWPDFSSPGVTWKGQYYAVTGGSGVQGSVEIVSASLVCGDGVNFGILCGGPVSASCGVTPRSLHTMAASSTQLLLVGGVTRTDTNPYTMTTIENSTGDGLLDVWVAETTDANTIGFTKFTRPSASTPWPTARRQASLAASSSTIALFGGYDKTNTALSDLWLWTRTGAHTGAWECVCNCYDQSTLHARYCEASPPKRGEGGFAYDAARDRFLLFGGSVDGYSGGDLWELNPATKKWTMLCGTEYGVPCAIDSPVSVPEFSNPGSYRSDNVSMAYDAARKRMVIPGGYSSGYKATTFEIYVRGNACASANDCDRSGSTGANAYCTNGACCMSADCGTCKSCADPKGDGDPGNCENIPQNQPDSAHGCAACDGNGACKSAPGAACSSGSTCASGFCVNSVCCSSPSCGAGTQCGATASPAPGQCLSQQGQACVAPSSCATGNCVDTTCCSTATCPGGQHCNFGGGTCKKDKGQACGTSAECGSANCVEGVCCESTCAGACDTCAAAGALGTCVPLAAGGTPQSSCGNYLCNGASASCPTTCAGDAQCSAAAFCRTSDGTCQPDQANGAACSTGAQCASGNCVDGVCCNTACTGACQACSAGKTGGASGTCDDVVAGTDPDNECATDPTTSCQRDGSCNGAGACRKYASGTSCLGASCTAGVAQGGSCDGSGTCATTSTPCAAYTCNAGGTACNTTCSNDGQCAAGYYCAAGGVCAAKKAQGAVCTAVNQCTSGQCADGVCCDTACGGNCQACSAALKGGGANGVCGPVAAATDPKNDCSVDSANSCGTDGTCDGSGGCRVKSQGTVCGASTCVQGPSVGTQTGFACDGLGTCAAGTSSQCGLYVCQGPRCGTSCSTDPDCVAAAYCAGATCAADQDDGASCSRNEQCTSGHCVDGVCCDTACNGTCLSCSAAGKGAGSDGQCGPSATGSDPDNDCATDSPSSCDLDGACDGAGACRKYQPGTSCGATTCGGATGSTLTGQQCDGFGACLANSTTQCAPFVCNGSGCLTSCALDTDCVASSYCDGAGACPTKHQNGDACTRTGECASGFCVEGVCCDTACNGVCQSCSAAGKGTGADGVCAAAGAGQDPHLDCTDEGAASCKKNGVCDGQGACSLYAEGTPCGATTCDGNVQTGYTCSGFGDCRSDSRTDCLLYACLGGTCSTSCSTDAECGPTAFCGGGSCVAKSGNGAACTLADTCESGFCVDGVCCDAACSGQCQACDVATAVGRCSPVAGAPHGVRPACAGAPGSTPDELCAARACDGTRDVNACVGYVGSDVACRGQSCADGTETFSAACDGKGSCGDLDGGSKIKKCAPFVCADDKVCLDSCDSDDDCSSGGRCEASTGQCVSSTTCDGDHTITNASQETTDCSPFRCTADGACIDRCTATSDCISNYVCNADRVCVAPSDGAPAEDSGCGCRAAGTGRGTPGAALALLALAGALLRSRGRGRRGGARR